MSARSLLAPVALAVHRLLDAVTPPPPGAVRIVLVHDVPPERESAFRRLVAHCRDRFGFVSPQEAEARLAGGVADGRAPVLLTFDDGFASNARMAEEILEPQGIRALFFVCPGLIDRSGAERRAAIAAHVFRGQVSEARLPAQLDLMGWDVLAGLKARGHAIGCHSMDHDRLAGLSPEALERQVAGAKARMAEMLGEAGEWFAYPFGDVDSIDSPALAMIGRHFRYCRSGVRGMADSACPPLALPGESIDLGEGRAWQDLAVSGGLARFYGKARAALLAKCPKVSA